MSHHLQTETYMTYIHTHVRVSGELNGESIIGQDLNCYVVTEDGRTYTAISRLEEGLGWQLQAAVPLGTVISWLFARPEGGGQNGFSIPPGLKGRAVCTVLPCNPRQRSPSHRLRT